MNQNQQALLSFVLGNDSVLLNKQKLSISKVNRNLILNSAMFWNSKKRVQKIKTLFMNSIGLKQFDDVDDFKVEELQNIELLSLSKNQIIHLHPISHLTTLISLNVSFNKVYDLNPLSKLQKLQELYASHNEIKTIEPLKELKNLKNLQLYQNKIHSFKDTFETLVKFDFITELDIQNNPVAEDKQFVGVISNSFPSLKKINGKLNKSSQKIKQMSSSNGFMNTSIKGFGTTSLFFNTSKTSFIDPEKTFYDFCKKKSSNSQSYEKRKQKQNILQKLQIHYKDLDEDFQKQIVKNVKLKNRLYKIMENKKNSEIEKEDKMLKSEEVKQLKRKVKALKDQLFTKDKKGELLRKLFQVEMAFKTKQTGKSKIASNNIQDFRTKQQAKKLQELKNQIKWTRRFQADQVFVIESNLKYLSEETEQIANLLGSIDSSIKSLKQDIDYLS